jgi:hypothetical protein
MKHPDDETNRKLTELLAGAGPGTLPILDPDPHLPAHVRALARAGAAPRHAPRRCWLPVSVGAAVVALALLFGGYLGYQAGAALAVSSAEASPVHTPVASADALWSVWSQSGFADDLRQWDDAGNEAE